MKLLSVLFLIFFCLLVTVSVFPVLGLDVYISHFIQSIHLPYFNSLMLGISYFGDSMALEAVIALVVIALLFYGWKKEAFITLTGMLFTTILTILFKEMANRPRPSSDLVNAYKIFPDKSFPSLHVVTYSVFFGYMFYLAAQKIGNKYEKIAVEIVSALIICLVGVSRIYLGAHWFTDVIGGYLLSFIILLVIIRLDKRFTKNVKR